MVWWGLEIVSLIDRSQNNNNNNLVCDDSKSICSYLLSSACFPVSFLSVGMYYASIEILIAEEPKRYEHPDAPDIAPSTQKPTPIATPTPDLRHRHRPPNFGPRLRLFPKKEETFRGGLDPHLSVLYHKTYTLADRYIVHMPQVRY